MGWPQLAAWGEGVVASTHMWGERAWSSPKSVACGVNGVWPGPDLVVQGEGVWELGSVVGWQH